MFIDDSNGFAKYITQFAIFGNVNHCCCKLHHYELVVIIYISRLLYNYILVVIIVIIKASIDLYISCNH